MSLRPMFIGEMLRVTKPWVTEGDPAHQVIIDTPELAGFVPALLKVHGALYAALPPLPDGREAELKAEAA